MTPEGQDAQGLCRNGHQHYCPNCDNAFVAASLATPEPSAAYTGKCVECGTLTCGYCGISDESGKWYCERCTKRAPEPSAAEQGVEILKNELSDLRAELTLAQDQCASAERELNKSYNLLGEAESALSTLRGAAKQAAVDVASFVEESCEVSRHATELILEYLKPIDAALSSSREVGSRPDPKD
jgi:hypothetical protein